MNHFRLVLLAVFLCTSTQAFAAFDQRDTPAALRDWVEWAKRDLQYRDCPLLAGMAGNDKDSYACIWPGEIKISVDANGASFTQSWQVFAKAAVPLPGNGEHWPQNVRVNGNAAAVTGDTENRPELWLEKGEHQISGRFDWTTRPSSLAVPEVAARVVLNLDGQNIFPLQREGEDLWLGAAQGTREADNITVVVNRAVRDGVPIILETRVTLSIAGEGREENVGIALPKGFIPLTLNADLPARLDNQGKLLIQARPGDYTVTINARAASAITEIQRGEVSAQWPDQEIWVFAANPRLRSAEMLGGSAVDPSQTDLPNAWKAMPSILVDAQSKLIISESARGISAQDKNRLSLTRTLWLNFDGETYTAEDQLNGSMVRDWRLDLAAPHQLTRAAQDGEAMLITLSENDSMRGVEQRQHTFSVEASALIDASDSSLPITGWQQDFDQVNTTLILPPGYRLFAALGADDDRSSWLKRWDLLAIFWLTLATLMAFYLGRWPLAAITLAFISLAYYENNAPIFTAVILIAVALAARSLPEGKAANAVSWVQKALLVSLAIWTLPYAAEQFRLTLHPQLEGSRFEQPIVYEQEMILANESSVSRREPAPPPPPASPVAAELKYATADLEGGQKLDKVTVTGSRINRSDMLQRYASNVQLQAGASRPGWDWRSHSLGWNGPITPEQTVRLIITPPWLTGLWRVATVLLLAIFAWLILRASGFVKPLSRVKSNAAAILLSALVLPALLLPVPTLAQSTPNPTVLEQLQQAIKKAPDCAPECATISSAKIALADDSANIALEIHVNERSAVALPFAGLQTQITQLSIDGKNSPFARAKNSDQAWIALAAGVHQVNVTLRLGNAEKIALRFPQVPGFVAITGRSWDSSGVRDNRLLTDTIELLRLRESASASDPSATQNFPSFVDVQRRIYFDLDWRVHTTVWRRSPKLGAVTIRLPLLAGEKVTSSEFKVADGIITVSIQAGEETSDWSSELTRESALTLTAANLDNHAETWQFVVSPTWRVQFNGVANVYPENTHNWMHEFHPLPGETLNVQIDRPEAADGNTVAIDEVSLTSSLGTRATAHALQFTLRSTQGGRHEITLPELADINSIEMDGNAINLRPENGKLSLPIKPGKQIVNINWREHGEIGFRSSTPAINLNAATANIRTKIAHPADRWILVTTGAGIGPAVLYWAILLVMLLFAFGVSRTKRTPLKIHHWLLLSVGFSTVSWEAGLVVVVWLFALDARSRWENPTPSRWFILAQLGLLALTFFALVSLLSSIPSGLLGSPEMRIAGPGSYFGNLAWFMDKTSGELPVSSIFSVSLWWYKALMLAWSLWLANALLGWLRWAWTCYSHGGYWRSAPKKVSAQDANREVPK